jgi:hypothetical protein
VKISPEISNRLFVDFTREEVKEEEEEEEYTTAFFEADYEENESRTEHLSCRENSSKARTRN